MLTDFMWNRTINHVLTLPVHRDHKVSRRFGLKLPSYANYRIGFVDDKLLDNYCVVLIDGRSVHIKVYQDNYLVHWDQRDPNLDPLGHLWHDAKKELFLGLIVADEILLNGKIRKWAISKASQVLGLFFW